MYKKLDEVKVLRDPVHGYIHIELQVIWDCLNTAWFQRLRRVHQLGGASMVYHCAEHTRFAHSLGVYEIVRRMITEVPDIAGALNEKEKVTVLLAGLLHDIGHGPFSHSFEGVTGISHETMTCRIIEENTEITQILERTEPGLAKDVADVIRHSSYDPLMTQLVSSQLDADRFDYLLRDAYFTGTKYGEFDMERILRTMRVSEDRRLVVKHSGVYAVENYIMARYHMYWQVYYHPVARSFECLVHMLFRRMKNSACKEDIPDLFKITETPGRIALEEYFRLDDYSCSSGFNALVSSSDPVLKDLAERVRDRNLFGYEDSDKAVNRRIRSTLRKLGYDLEYYWGKDTVAQAAYIPYTGGEDGTIKVRMKDGSIKELSQASSIVSSLVHGPANDDNKVFFPKEAERCE